MDRNRGGKRTGGDLSPPGPVVEDRSKHDLIASDEAWASIGVELKRVDPARYLAMLALAEDIVAIHEDPIHARRQVNGKLVFPKKNDDRAPD
jgi:hypothetical protein